MGLPWVRLDTAFPHNPKLLSLLGEKDGYRAALVYVCGLAYSGAQGSDGYIPEAALPFIHARRADADRLVAYNFWQKSPGGWEINDWAEFQQSSEETQARKGRLQDRSRKANCVRWHGQDCGCWRRDER